MKEIIKKIESKGYVVEVKNNIDVNEPFTSDVTGEKFYKNIAFSTSKDDVKFLTEVLSNL